MNLANLSEDLNVEESIVKRAAITNGFSIDSDYDEKQENLIRMYVDYLLALEDAKKARIAFKYADGEESVDKSRLFDQYRRFANDLYGAWEDVKKAYDKELSGQHSFFMLRNRAGFLDERTSE
ncbi:hypothetical protein [Macrococcus capreoli]|uniref:hypothetical protein n=1 Tax=Macrococcus capreoli TaxID=2982690 RepID=UPI0021D60CBF|nr:hypothetical protein [Macrococcus sp. TMW 2.2395]MCU7556537.1 hypothetical protein [Macrococcus sp. TMW 2.2395]